MDYKSLDGSLIKAYLLGELVEEERHEFEKRMMTDDDLYNQVLVGEDELIEQYALGLLSSKEKESFEASFLATEEGREQVSLTNDLIRYASTRSAERPQPASKQPQPARLRKPSFFISYARAFAAAIIILAVGFGVWRLFIYESDIDKGASALRSAYRDNRPVEARLTGFDYAPTVTLRSDDQAKVDLIARNLAERILLDEVIKNPGSASYHALGQLYLSERKFDDAIRLFEDALKADQQNARAHSDLGAARLEKGKIEHAKEDGGNSLEEFARALTHISKALELDSTLLEALFNKALCHQYMGLPQQAEQDWQNYLAKDSASPWADEARHNLGLIQQQKKISSLDKEELFQIFLSAHKNGDDESAWKVISRNRDVSGSFVENRLIDSYLDPSSKRYGVDANESLEALSYAAKLEARKAGDLFVSDLVQFYKPTSAEQQVLLAQARSLTEQAREHLDNSNFDQALGLYGQAKQIFEQQGGTVEATFIQYCMGHCYLLQGKTAFGLSTFRELAALAKKHNYKWLLAQSLNAIANAQVTLRDYSAAINSSTQSLNLSKEIGDLCGEMRTLAQLALEYRYLNNYQRALGLHQRSLALGSVFAPEPIQVWRDYFMIAQVLSQMGLLVAANDYNEEALQIAIKMKSPQLISRSYTNLGMTYASLNNYDRAITAVEKAFEIGKSLPDELAQNDAMAFSFLQLGHIYKQAGDFKKAIENFDQAILFYDRSGFEGLGYAAHKGRLVCGIAQGATELIEQELKLTLDLFEQHRSKILEESNRNSFFDIEQNIYDVAINFEYSKREDSSKARAFEYSEASRARTLRDLISQESQPIISPYGPDMGFADATKAMSLSEIQAKLSENTQVLQYAVLDDKLLIWVITKNGLEGAEQDIGSKTLEEEISKYLRMLPSMSESDSDDLQLKAARLYDVLVRPVEQFLDKKRQICIVPDKVLNRFPFGALFSNSSQKYFIEEYSYILSSSSSLFVISSEVAREKEKMKNERLTCVGNPLFDREVFDSLADLPAAAREAKTISGYYGQPNLLLGPEATKNLVMKEMARGDVIHLALHSVTDEEHPMHSKLLLAKGPRGGGPENQSKSQTDATLEVHEIYKMALPRAKLVVLSSCRSGVERYYGGEGMIGISRPFIAKRIPLVVASLWPVESNSTAELMIRFHKYRKSKGENISTVEALRRAQLELLQGKDRRFQSPYYWASFTAIGGHASF